MFQHDDRGGGSAEHHFRAIDERWQCYFEPRLDAGRGRSGARLRGLPAQYIKMIGPAH